MKVFWAIKEWCEDFRSDKQTNVYMYKSITGLMLSHSIE